MKTEEYPSPQCFPGPGSVALLEEFARYVVTKPYPFVLDLDAGHGMFLVTVDGQEIFDWAGYYGSKLIGHSHPGLREPDYMRRLVIAANNKAANPDFLTRECVEYYRLLHEIAPGCMRQPKLEVYVVNSGAEAVENLIKYLLVLHQERFPASHASLARKRFIYFDRAFHGRTMFALNVTQPLHDPAVVSTFQDYGPGNICIPFPSTDGSQPAEYFHCEAVSCACVSSMRPSSRKT